MRMDQIQHFLLRLFGVRFGHENLVMDIIVKPTLFTQLGVVSCINIDPLGEVERL